MGSAASRFSGLHHVHAELDKLSVQDVINQISKDQSFVDINRTTVTEETLVNDAIEAASKVGSFSCVFFAF